MERKSIILAALLLVTPASAMDDGGGWFGEWYQQWSQTEQRVEQRGQQVQKVEKTRCEIKLGKYRSRVEENPDSGYYSWKLRYWEEKCGADE